VPTLSGTLGALLDAPAAIALTSCSMKAGSEYGLGATINAVSRGLSSCLRPSIVRKNLGWKQIWSWLRGVKTLSLRCLFVSHRDNTFRIQLSPLNL